MSLIEESSFPEVRMSHLAMAGSHAINAVSRVHSELVRTGFAKDFSDLYPLAFTHVTNGISQRRWLLQANPELAGLITRRIGPGWLRHLEALRELEAFAEDPAFQDEFRGIKLGNKQRLATFIHNASRLPIDTGSIFDVHVKRFHAYKRQLLQVLHVAHSDLALIDFGVRPALPRTYFFS